MALILVTKVEWLGLKVEQILVQDTFIIWLIVNVDSLVVFIKLYTLTEMKLKINPHLQLTVVFHLLTQMDLRLAQVLIVIIF